MKRTFARWTLNAVCFLLAAGLLCSCAQNENREENSEGGSTAASGTVSVSIPEDADVTPPETEGAVTVSLQGQSAQISGDGAQESDGVITVTAGGTYCVSGSLSDGRIIVNAPKQEVTLVLQNADIHCSYGSPLYIYDCSEATVYLADGSENILSDGESYTFADSLSSAADEEPNACLYAKDDLIIAGSGSLTVNANYNNGITGKDTLKIEGATVTVVSRNHGINGKDSCYVKAATATVECGGDALRSTNDSDSTKGNIAVTDSVLHLTSGEDGIQAETTLYLRGVTANVTAGGGSSAKANSETSTKGIKSGGDMQIVDGTYVIDSCDDAIHTNGSVSIEGGSFTVSTGDDGIHADETVTVSDGSIGITKSYEGIEGAVVNITGGDISINASDDGLNAAGGRDQSGFGGRPDNFGNNSSYAINISGGRIEINASGDGIDSNGSLCISGGEVYVSGPTNNGDGALDYDGSASITGGTIIAAGSSGMAQNFGSESTQGSMLLTFSQATEGSVTLCDADGNVLAQYTPQKQYSCVVVSSPSLVLNGTYTVTAGTQTQTVTLTSLIYGGGGMNPGGQGGMDPGNMPNGNRPGGRPNADGQAPNGQAPNGDPTSGDFGGENRDGIGERA